jgi:hypothetical protein
VYKQNQAAGGSEISIGLPSKGVLSVDRADAANKRFNFGSAQKPPRKESAGYPSAGGNDIVFHSVNGQLKFHKGLAEEDSLAEQDESPESLIPRDDIKLFKMASAIDKQTSKNLFEDQFILHGQDSKPALMIHDPESGDNPHGYPNVTDKANELNQQSHDRTGQQTNKLRQLKLVLQETGKPDDFADEPVRQPPRFEQGNPADTLKDAGRPVNPNGSEAQSEGVRFGMARSNQRQVNSNQSGQNLAALQNAPLMEGDVSVRGIPVSLISKPASGV